MSIKTHFYNPTRGKGRYNFGDMLVPIILNWVTGQDVEWVPADTNGKVLCIGSELASGPLKEDDVVWGYGAKLETEINLPENVQILALRGPKSKNLIQQDIGKIPFGDPACIMPMIYQPKLKESKFRMGVIPHYIDKNKFEVKDKTILVIDVNQSPFDIIDQINNCDFIVSTSLHGAIVAEAYGKKVVWLKVSDSIRGMDFKWNDYISGTEREETDPVVIYKDIIISKDLYPLEKFCLASPKNNSDRLLKAWRSYYDQI